MMKDCPFCREKIQEGALKCRHCQSMLMEMPGKPEEAPQKQATYILDKGLVTYLKVAAGILALILGIAAFVFGFDLAGGRKDLNELSEKLKGLVEKQKEDFEKRQADLKTKTDLMEIGVKDFK